ncbi:MAG: cobyric acid synthase CobQ, partial [Dehalococcoidia bacterium]|nr:cobyric acid synthase CobQ [Dehalococcoidia bacterium]
SVFLESRPDLQPDGNALDIAIIRLPRIANFDDFDPLGYEPDARVRYVHGPRDLGRPDLLIIPGTKSTLADLAYLYESGLATRVSRLAREGVPIVGICGGYQMLGRKIADPLGVESNIGEMDGLGLLDVETEFAAGKTTSQVTATVIGNRGLLAGSTGQTVTGYEIHMGQTRGSTDLPAFGVVDRGQGTGDRETSPDPRPLIPDPYLDGQTDETGNIVGTYLHGLFHNAGFRRNLLDAVRRLKGMPPLEAEIAFSRDREYDKLADLVRSSIDIDAVYAMIGLR